MRSSDRDKLLIIFMQLSATLAVTLWSAKNWCVPCIYFVFCPADKSGS